MKLEIFLMPYTPETYFNFNYGLDQYSLQDFAIVK